MIDRIREELIAKRKELERRTQVRSLEMIEWINSLLKQLEEKPQPNVKEITVELPKEVAEELTEDVVEEAVEQAVEQAKEELKKPAPKRKIVFKKK